MNARRNVSTALIILLACAGMAAAAEQDGTARAALDRLKALEGTWHGSASGGEGEGEGEQQVTHVFEVSAAGTVVMETMNPGSPDHEMINMYHLDGEDLVLTHYCAGGNQPTMRLVQPLAADNEMKFDFTGGTNFDPAKDGHIHAGRLVMVDADTLESSWTGYQGGEEVGVTTFLLERGD
jgi:hypothetical protein